MVIAIPTNNREIHVGGSTFAEEDLLGLLQGKLSPAALANIAAAAAQAATAAVAGVAPQITADASANAIAAMNAALALLPKLKAGAYTITPADASAGTVTIPTGLATPTAALLELFDATGVMLFPPLKYAMSGSSIVLSKNALLWSPIAGQKVNWIAVGN